MPRPRIILHMIVRDESRVIERCLERVKPWIDGWLIVDTGSVDDTKAKVQACMKGVPGLLFDGPLHTLEGGGINHGATRNAALDLVRQNDGDYLLFLDADDTWDVEEGFAWPEPMNADGYFTQIRQNGTVFKRVVITKASKPWSYSGTQHAILTCAEPHVLDTVTGVRIEMHGDGNRRASSDPAKKYRNDAQEFLRQLDENPRNHRAMYYLAQSLRDSKQLRQAAYWYHQRGASGGWAEEAFSAKYEYAKLLRQMNVPFEQVRDAFLDAHRARPHRAEPLLALAELYRAQGDISSNFVYAAAAKELPWPKDDILFVEEDCYNWKALDEYAMACWRIGQRELAAAAHVKLLQSPGLPEQHLPRLRRNYRYCDPRAIDFEIVGLESVLDQLCVTILTGRRLPRLRQTIEALPLVVLERAHVVVYVNGEDHESFQYVKSLPFVDQLVYESWSKPEPIGDAVSRLARYAGFSSRTLWFHLEDDWECQSGDANFLLDAARILENPHIGQVRFRLASDRMLSTHMVTGQPYRWKDEMVCGVACRTADVHFTFNPSLVRVEDSGEIYPVDHELTAAKHFHLQGWKVAQLVPGVFRHTGAQESLRMALGR